MLKKLIRWVRMTIVGFFYGMKGADETIINSTVSEPEGVVQHKALNGNVFSDMLAEQETEKVKEMRDMYYRTYREADKYLVQVSGMGIDGENLDDEDSELTAVAVKKAPINKPRTPLYETKGYKVVLVQGAKEYENDMDSRMKEAALGESIDDKDTLIFSIKYHDGITPHFLIERYIQKLAVKENKSGKVKFDLYFSIYARQFVKRDSLFIAELNKVYKKELRQSDFDDIEQVEFVTDKAFGSESLHKISLTNIKFKKIDIFDGNFVLEFDAKMTDDDITAKYQTESLDKKYAEHAPKQEAIDINVLIRHIDDKNNSDYSTTILKLK